MHRIDKLLLTLTSEEVQQIRSAVLYRDKVEALRVLKEVLAKKIELMLKKRCK